MTQKNIKVDPRLQALKALLQVLPGAKSPKSLNQLCQNSADAQLNPTNSTLQAEAITPFAQVLIYGVCRYFQPLQAIIDARLVKPLKAKDFDIKIMLLLGLFQILFTSKPHHAILNDTTELARKRKKQWATGLVNGTLRALLRDHQAQKLPAICAEAAFPNWLAERISAQYSPVDAQTIFENSLIPAPMSLRHNARHLPLERFKEQLERAELHGEWSERTPGCFTLSAPQDVEKIPGFFQGSCSVQDEAAQWATRILNPKPGSRVLDACAAPGGKTGHLLEWAENIMLSALDVSPERLKSIQSNLDRLYPTLQNETVTAAPPVRLIATDAAAIEAWWDNTPFDHILLDAPCSGSGVLRRHPDIFWLKRASDIDQLAQLQKRLLEQLWRTLAPGGTLLYCTCSILAEENAAQISNFLEQHPEAILENLDNTALAKSSKISLTDGRHNIGLQILPKAKAHDGFYYALLTKASNQ